MCERAACVLSSVQDRFLPRDTINIYLILINFHKHKENSDRFVQSSSIYWYKKPIVTKWIKKVIFTPLKNCDQIIWSSGSRIKTYTGRSQLILYICDAAVNKLLVFGSCASVSILGTLLLQSAGQWLDVAFICYMCPWVFLTLHFLVWVAENCESACLW